MCSLQPLDVCAAVIVRQGRYLLALRPAKGHLENHWEFPGGKVHKGESLQQCITRELAEELAVDVIQATHICTIDHNYSSKTVRLHFLRCEIAADVEPQALEHKRLGWFSRQEAATLKLAPADLKFVLLLRENTAASA